jgi:hypothetical protein
MFCGVLVCKLVDNLSSILHGGVFGKVPVGYWKDMSLPGAAKNVPKLMIAKIRLIVEGRRNSA